MDFIKLKQYMDRLVSEYHTPGVDCIVYRDHEMLYRYYTGLSDIENQKEICGDELYVIFSMTKMLTCVGALQLLEKGRYLLNDPLSMYMPEFEQMRIAEKYGYEYAKNPITIQHLFTMTAGLNYDMRTPAIKKALAEGRTGTRDIVAALSETILDFEPGTGYQYSLCHDVLGALIEIWSGKTVGQYMKENVFEPLGMKDTCYGFPTDEESLARLVVRYRYNNRTKSHEISNFEDLVFLSKEYESGGGGVISSTADYALFLDALASGGIGKNGTRVLSSSTIDLMGINYLRKISNEEFCFRRKGYGYGLGVRTHIDKDESGSLSPIGEFGWDGAAGGFSMVDTVNKVSFTYFQQMEGWTPRMQSEMRNIIYSCLE